MTYRAMDVAPGCLLFWRMPAPVLPGAGDFNFILWGTKVVAANSEDVKGIMPPDTFGD